MFLYALVALAALLFYWKYGRSQTYWTEKGVKQGKQTPFIGDPWGFFRKKLSLAEFVRRAYGRFPEERYSGTYQFTKPFFVIRDPDLVRQITVKDFDHFTDHLTFIPEGSEPIWSKNLIALKGETWRQMRATLSPAFTSSKMRAMFQLMSDCAENFTNYFLKKNEHVITVELKDIFTRYTNDIIGTCSFGIHCDSLSQRDNEFYKMGKELTTMSFRTNVMFFISAFCPKLFSYLGLSMFKKALYKFFTSLIEENIKEREEKSIIRPDMIHLLMEARKGRLQYEESKTESKETGFATVEESNVGIRAELPKQEITIQDMTAQALLFFFAGFETISVLMCFMGYELALNPDIQKRLQEEVDETWRNCRGKVSYEAVSKMKYLDMIIAETLRKWPPASLIDRVCTKPYTIQPTKSTEVPVNLTKGDVVWVPVYGFHRDPAYYEDPDKFDPERFSDENKANINPYAYFPFGVGPRNCIGSRFALLEAKAIWVHLLAKFELVVIEKTEIPLELDKQGFSFNAKNGFWLGLKKRAA